MAKNPSHSAHFGQFANEPDIYENLIGHYTTLHFAQGCVIGKIIKIDKYRIYLSPFQGSVLNEGVLEQGLITNLPPTIINRDTIIGIEPKLQKVIEAEIRKINEKNRQTGLITIPHSKK